jgi:three-Cys-motif partner protein
MEAMPPPPSDGLPDRKAGAWVGDKLRTLWCYMHGFASASQKAGRWHYVDGMASFGVNSVGRDLYRLSGSPLLALETRPPFARCLFMDLGITQIRALRERTRRYGSRAVVVQGDSNRDLVPAMREHIYPRWCPCLVVLDPEGSELKWSTVRDIAGFRTGKRKAEQLILLPTDTGFVRELPIEVDPTPEAAARITAMYGNERWRDIYRRRRAGELSPDQARSEYVRLYAEGLKEELGYKHVLDRQILQHGKKGHSLYFLIFATDHDVGRKIMNHCMDTGYPDDGQGELIRYQRPMRLEH